MLKTKYNNPLEGFVVHGVKEIGSYTYVLLVDMTGQTIIKRVATDNSTIMFALKEEGVTIPVFWAGATSHEYKYLYQV